MISINRSLFYDTYRLEMSEKSKIKTLYFSLTIISYQVIDLSKNIYMNVENNWEWDKRDLNRGTSAQGQLV
jgi:hypothetical protein